MKVKSDKCAKIKRILEQRDNIIFFVGLDDKYYVKKDNEFYKYNTPEKAHRTFVRFI